MGTALVLLTGALLVAHAALVIVLVEGAALDWLTAFLVVGAIDLVPVSYTHLTLPTICSV